MFLSRIFEMILKVKFSKIWFSKLQKFSQVLFKNRPFLRAFSILEAAFALLLIGIFATIIIPYWKLLHDRENYFLTQSRANYVRKAVQGYVARHGFLPYSGDSSGFSKNGLVRGLVPYKTLGIPQRLILDGYGSQFSFIVNEFLTRNFWLEKGYKILPITLPVNIFQDDFGVSFTRIYGYSKILRGFSDDQERAPEVIEALPKFSTGQVFADSYDQLLVMKNRLVLSQNGQKIQLSKIQIYDKFIFDKESEIALANVNNLRSILTIRSAWDESPDVVAWVLVSNRGKKRANCNEKYEISLDSSDLTFWQSRFNLAAQIHHPATSLPMDWTGTKFERIFGCDYRKIENLMYPVWRCHAGKKPVLKIFPPEIEKKLKEKIAEINKFGKYGQESDEF